MKRLREFALLPLLIVGPFLLASSMAVGLQGCALFQKKVKDIPDDIRQCFGPDVKGDLGSLVSGIEAALVCELSSGGNALPACVIEGLQTIADRIGPSGKADVRCVIDKIATDAAARQGKAGLTPEEAVRDARAKLLNKQGVFVSVLSPGDSKPVDPPSSLIHFAMGGEMHTPMATFAANWATPAACMHGSHDLSPAFPGAACIRDDLTWEDVVSEMRAECLQRTCEIGFGGSPFADAATVLSGANYVEHVELSQAAEQRIVKLPGRFDIGELPEQHASGLVFDYDGAVRLMVANVTQPVPVWLAFPVGAEIVMAGQ